MTKSAAMEKHFLQLNVTEDTELHAVTENGIIMIFNAYTKIHVTDLIARPEQLKRYGKPVPEQTLQKAKNHIAKGWNYV